MGVIQHRFKMKLIAGTAAMMWLPAAFAFTPFTVKEIRAQGLQRLEIGTVLTYLPLSVGDQVNEQTSRQAMRALYGSGLFEDVALERDGDTLVITFHGALSPAEQALLRTPDGAAQVQDYHRKLWGIQEFYRAFSLVNGGMAFQGEIFHTACAVLALLLILRAIGWCLAWLAGQTSRFAGLAARALRLLDERVTALETSVGLPDPGTVSRLAGPGPVVNRRRASDRRSG